MIPPIKLEADSAVSCGPKDQVERVVIAWNTNDYLDHLSRNYCCNGEQQKGGGLVALWAARDRIDLLQSGGLSVFSVGYASLRETLAFQLLQR